MLTDAKARAAKPRSKSYKLTDANRLFLLVTPSGGKLWRWSYTYDGKQKGMAFGAYPLVSLADARAKRDEAYTALCEGHDPAIAKKLRIEANIEANRQTFELVAREWHENAKSQWATIHANDIIRTLRSRTTMYPARTISTPASVTSCRLAWRLIWPWTIF
ncbi:MAG: Arm DNA-binding domain-containing protein [Sphingomonas sp.]